MQNNDSDLIIQRALCPQNNQIHGMMEQRNKNIQGQHQPLFKASQQSAGAIQQNNHNQFNQKYESQNTGNPSYRQFVQNSDTLANSKGMQQVLSDRYEKSGDLYLDQHKNSLKVQLNKHYSVKTSKPKRKYLTRVPSRSLEIEDGGKFDKIAIESTNATNIAPNQNASNQFSQGSQLQKKFKLDMQKPKKGAMTRKTSKVGSLISSMVIPSNQLAATQQLQTADLIHISGQAGQKKFNLQTSVPNSPKKNKTANVTQLVQNLKGMNQTGQQNKKKTQLFNSVVHSVQNNELSTPKVASRGHRRAGNNDPTLYVGLKGNVNTTGSGEFNSVNDLAKHHVSSKSLGPVKDSIAQRRQESNRQSSQGPQELSLSIQPVPQNSVVQKKTKPLNPQARTIAAMGLQRRSSNQNQQTLSEQSSNPVLLKSEQNQVVVPNSHRKLTTSEKKQKVIQNPASRSSMQNPLQKVRQDDNSSRIQSGSFSMGNQPDPNYSKQQAIQTSGLTTPSEFTSPALIPASPYNLTPNISVNENNGNVYQINNQPSSLSQTLSNQISHKPNGKGNDQKSFEHQSYVTPASYYLLHGNFKQKGKKTKSGAKSIQEPAANQLLSNIMKISGKESNNKSSSHGVNTPNTGGGYKQNPALNAIKVPKQMIQQINKQTSGAGNEKFTPSFADKKLAGQRNQDGSLTNALNARVIAGEQQTNTESGRSLLGKVVVERSKLSVRKRVTEHQLQNNLERQGRSLDREEMIQVSSPSGLSSQNAIRRGLAATQEPGMIQQNLVRQSLQSHDRFSHDQNIDQTPLAIVTTSDSGAQKKANDQTSRYTFQGMTSSEQNDKPQLNQNKLQSRAGQQKIQQMSIKQQKGKQKPLSRDGSNHLRQSTNLRDSINDMNIRGNTQSPDRHPSKHSSRKIGGKKVISIDANAQENYKTGSPVQVQIKTVPKSNRQSLHASAIPRPNQNREVQMTQGQNLLNLQMTNSRRTKRPNLSKEPISSLERSSNVAEQVFTSSVASKGHQHMPSVVSPKMQLFKNISNPSQSSIEAFQRDKSVTNTNNSLPTQNSQVDLQNERKEFLQISELDEENLDRKPKSTDGPRDREIKLLTQVIRDCFTKHGKMPKTQIMLYKVGKVLGKGAFGKVNLGLHRLTRKLVAIKSTTKDHIKEESMKRKMQQEIDILRALRHPSHIRLLETFQTEKHYLIVMELCPGGDLLNYVRKRRKLAEGPAKTIFLQIMQGIAYMHQQGIVHRDIKLDNILLDGHGNIKIGDFGVSRKVISDELLFEQCGTPAYIAPEIVQEIGYKGFPVDIWSAGVCLYAILYGNVPFKANQIGDLNTELYQNEIEYKETASEQARDLMRKMLQKDVKKRLNAIEVLNHPWLTEDVDTEINIFDEQEKNLIKKEFTYLLQKKKIEKSPDRGLDDLNTQFTEHSISATDGGLQKNSSTKSVILCPFNSRQQDPEEQEKLVENCHLLMEDKDQLIRFNIHCRELDRAYEKFNNQDFDNGVYHKFAYKSHAVKKKDGEEQNEHEEQTDKQANYADNQSSQQTLRRRQTSLTRIVNGRIMTPEEDKYQKIDNAVVQKVSQYGFPSNTIINCLKQNLVNHCTATYYLLLMDQNF